MTKTTIWTMLSMNNNKKASAGDACGGFFCGRMISAPTTQPQDVTDPRGASWHRPLQPRTRSDSNRRGGNLPPVSGGWYPPLQPRTRSDSIRRGRCPHRPASGEHSSPLYPRTENVGEGLCALPTHFLVFLLTFSVPSAIILCDN